MKSANNIGLRIAFVCICGLAVSTTATYAQDALEEIVVTASKRGAQSLQGTGATIDVFTGSRLEDLGLDDFADFAQFTPGLDFQKSGVARTQYIVRGLSTGRVTTAEPQNRSLVGILLDDIPIDLNGLNPDLDLFDIERVEVVKGPQGSLFGDSAMSGAVRYVTKAPDLEQFLGRAIVSASNTHNGGDNYTAKVAVNVPLIDGKLGARGSLIYRDNSGWVDNARTGEADLNNEETIAARVNFLWRPTDKFDSKLLLMIQDTDGGHEAIEESGVGPDGLPRPGIGSLAFSRDTNETISDRFALASLEISYQFDWGTVTSLTAVQNRDLDHFVTDFSEDVFPAFGLAILPNNVLLQPWENDRFTQELRLATSTEGNFEATVGLFYSDQDLTFDSFGSADGFDNYILAQNPFGIAPDINAFNALGCANMTDTWFCGPELNDVEQIALFGELYWHVTDDTTVTVGGRWFDYEQNFEQFFAGWFNFGDFPKISQNKEDGFNPKVAISHQATDDLLFYASAAKGFRLGGVSTSLPPFCDGNLAALGLTRADVDTFDSDSLWMYEVGAKSSWLDGRVILNGAVYYVEWDDIQTPINLPCGYIPTFNAAKVKGQGLDMETQVVFTDNLTAKINVAYISSELVGDAPALSGLDGDKVPFAPEWALSAFVDYHSQFTNEIEGFLSVGVRYTSESYDTFNRQNEIPSQTAANIRAGLAWDTLRLSLFADNVTDEENVTNARTRFGEVKRYIGRPRTVGLELAIDF